MKTGWFFFTVGLIMLLLCLIGNPSSVQVGVAAGFAIFGLLCVVAIGGKDD